MQVVFDTDIRGRTRSVSYEAEDGGIDNICVTEAFDEKGRRTYVTYAPFYGLPFNRFTKKKKEIAIMEKVNEFLGIEDYV